MSKNKNQLFVVILCAQWCAVCRQFKIDIQEFSKQTNNRVCWLDVETSSEWADEFEIDNFPTILLVDANNQVLFLGSIEPNLNTLAQLIRTLTQQQTSVSVSQEVRHLVERVTTRFAEYKNSFLDLS